MDQPGCSGMRYGEGQIRREEEVKANSVEEESGENRSQNGESRSLDGESRSADEGAGLMEGRSDQEEEEDEDEEDGSGYYEEEGGESCDLCHVTSVTSLYSADLTSLYSTDLCDTQSL